MFKRKPKEIKIEEFYRKEDGIVIRYWRYKGDKDWLGETTCYAEVPYNMITPTQTPCQCRDIKTGRPLSDNCPICKKYKPFKK